MSDMILLLLCKGKKMATGFTSLSSLVASFVFFAFSAFVVSCDTLMSHVADFLQSYPDNFLTNNEILGQALQAVGCMLPEQPMRLIYLSST